VNAYAHCEVEGNENHDLCQCSGIHMTNKMRNSHNSKVIGNRYHQNSAGSYTNNASSKCNVGTLFIIFLLLKTEQK
jgi:hypothetical protein